MRVCSLAVLICGFVLGSADERADYKRLCEIWRKTEPEAGRDKDVVTDEEKDLLLKELGGKRGGIAPHDFRRMAAITLGNLRDREAVPELIIRLEDRGDDPMTSAEAARALGKIGDVKALFHLLDALEDDRPGVRRHAADAFRTLSPDAEAIKPFATAMRFRALLDELGRIPLPQPGPHLEGPDISPAMKRAWWTAREVDAICTGLNLARPVSLAERDRARAEGLATKVLGSGFDARYYGPNGLIDLTRFCREFQPGLYAEKFKGR